MNTPLTQPDGILFDMDGVLAYVHDSYRKAISATAQVYGLHVSPEMIATGKAAGNANDDWALTRRFLHDAGINVSLDEVRDTFQDFYVGTGNRRGYRLSESLLIDRSDLENIFRTYPLGIVTGRPREDAQWFLDRFDLIDLFPTVVAMEDAPLKPDPAPVREAMKQMNLSSPWMIGDTPDDMQAAVRAGALGIGIGSQDEIENLLQAGAAIVLEHTRQLIEIIP